MRRIYVTLAAAATAMAALLATGAEAKYTRTPAMPGDENRPAVSRKLSPKQVEGRKHATKDPKRQLIPAQEGLFMTPRIQEKPANMMAKMPSKLRGKIHAIVNRHSSMTMYSQAYIGVLDQNTGELEPTFFGAQYCPQMSDDYLYASAALRDGIIYIPGTFASVTDLEVTWTRVDLNTGEVYSPISFGGDFYGDPYSLTYDESEDKFYSICYSEGTSSEFSVIDPNNDFNLEYIGNIGRYGFISALCYNPDDQQIYAFGEGMKVYTVNKKTGNLSDVAELDSYYVFCNDGEVTRVVYSPLDRCFITVFLDNDIEAARLLYIDPETWEVEEGEIVSAFSSPYIAALLCDDLYATPDAPELPATPEVSFDKNSLSGSITVTAPTLSYMGIELPASSQLDALLTIDGKSFISEKMKPGATKKIDVTLEQGVHNLELSFAVDKDNVSPVRKSVICVGNDRPEAPTNIKLVDGVLTWDAPTAGVNGGYVDFSVMAYHVYIDGVKENSRPISSTKYTLTMPDKQKKVRIEVEAEANQQKSPRGVLNEIIGKPMNLPVELRPTKEEGETFKVVDANNDGLSFIVLDEKENQGYGMHMWIGYVDDADDWFFLPAINFDNKDVLYNFTFNAASVWSTGSFEEFEIWIGKRPNPEDMNTLILEENEYSLAMTPESMSMNFAVPEPGAYYIGVHLKSTQKDSQGLLASDFEVTKLDKQTSAVPDIATDVNITAAPKGVLSATVKATLPKTDLLGKPLTGNLTMKVACEDEEATVSGAPGATVSVECKAYENGYNKFYITVSNANGEGMTRNYRAYVGHDQPYAPADITCVPSEDNMTAHFTWSAPGEVGTHGGYVDPEGLFYRFYNRMGVSYSNIGETKETKFDWTCYDPKQTAYHMGPAAVNAYGMESIESRFVQETIGKPYELPIIEEFNTSLFTISPYLFSVENMFAGSHWESVGNTIGLGIGDPSLVEGALLGYTETGGPGWGELIIPKFTTKGVDKCSVTFRFWDFSECPRLELWGRRAGQNTAEKIANISVSRPANGQWVDADVELPKEYNNCGWVQLRLRTRLEGTRVEYFVLDKLDIHQDVDYDLKVSAVEGQSLVKVGETQEYVISVVNSGYERLGGTLVTELIDKNGKVYQSTTTKVPAIVKGRTISTRVSFEFNGAHQDLGNMAVRATINADKDEVANNNVRSLDLTVKKATTPVVTDLTATRDEKTNDVALTWSEPVLTFGDILDAETGAEPFVPTGVKINDDNTIEPAMTSISNWKLYDGDGGNPFGITNIAAWSTGYDTPTSWNVFDAELANTMSGESKALTPHSGKRFLIARTNQWGDSEEDGFIQGQDWLISPEIVGGSDLTFYVNHIDPTYIEYIELWTSTSDDTPGPIPSYPDKANIGAKAGSFTKVKSWSISGAVGWDKVNWKFAPDVKYFAIVHRGISSFAVMLDDISCVPAQLSQYELDHFKLWRALNTESDIKCIAENIKGNTYSDPAITAEGATYYLTAVAKDPFTAKMVEGPKSNPAYIGISAVDDITFLSGVFGDKGFINVQGHDGDTIAVYAADGKFVKLAKVESDNARIATEAGVYIVKCGNAAAKVLVK